MGIIGKKKAEEKAEAARRAREERFSRMADRSPERDIPSGTGYRFSEEPDTGEEHPDLILPEDVPVRYVNPAVSMAAVPMAVDPSNERPSDTLRNGGELYGKPAVSFREADRSDNGQMTLFDYCGEEEAAELLEKHTTVENELVGKIREKISRDFGPRLIQEARADGLKKEIRAAVENYLKDEGANVTVNDRGRILERIMNLILGYGPLEELFGKNYTEIMVSRWDRIFVEEKGEMVDSGVRFGSEEELRSVIVKMCGRIGKTINKTNTRVDGDLEDGSRFNAIFPPSSPDGANLTIRRFSDHKIRPDEYLAFGSADRRMLYFLRKMVEAGVTMIASGGTGSGKTTLLNLLASFIPDDLSVLTIEDSLELKLPCTNWRRRLTRQSTGKDGAGTVSATDLVKNALRERPDRIVIGEIRDGTMADFLDAANSGHDGCLTTVHANSPRGLTSRVISLFKKANIEGYGTDDIKRLYADAVHLIVQIKRYPDHTRKISHISQVVGYGAEAAEELHEEARRPNDVYIKDIFRWKPDGGKDPAGRLTGSFIATGYVPEALLELASDNGIGIDRCIFDERAEWNGPEI